MALRFWVGRRAAARGLRFRVAQPLQAIPTEPRASTAKVGGFAKLSKTGFLSNLSRQKRSIQRPWFFLTRKPHVVLSSQKASKEGDNYHGKSSARRFDVIGWVYHWTKRQPRAASGRGWNTAP